MSKRRWVKLYDREDWECWPDDGCVKLMDWLLTNATAHDEYYKGTWLKAGQAVFGMRELSERLVWSRNKLQRVIEALAKSGTVAFEKTGKGTIATITKWEQYQVSQNSTTNSATNSATDSATNSATNPTLSRSIEGGEYIEDKDRPAYADYTLGDEWHV